MAVENFFIKLEASDECSGEISPVSEVMNSVKDEDRDSVNTGDTCDLTRVPHSTHTRNKAVTVTRVSIKTEPVIDYNISEHMLPNQENHAVGYPQILDQADIKAEPVFFEENFSNVLSSDVSSRKRVFYEDEDLETANTQVVADSDKLKGPRNKKARRHKASDGSVGQQFPVPVTASVNQQFYANYYCNSSSTTSSQTKDNFYSQPFLSNVNHKVNLRKVRPGLKRARDCLHDDSQQFSGYVSSGYKSQTSKAKSSDRKSSLSLTPEHRDRDSLSLTSEHRDMNSLSLIYEHGDRDSLRKAWEQSADEQKSKQSMSTVRCPVRDQVCPRISIVPDASRNSDGDEENAIHCNNSQRETNSPLITDSCSKASSTLVQAESNSKAKVNLASDSSDIVYQACQCSRSCWFEIEEAEIWKMVYRHSSWVVGNLGLLRFMGKTLFSFSLDNKLYIYLGELKFRGLLPLSQEEVQVVLNVLKSPIMAREMRNPGFLELEFTQQYVEYSILSVETAWMCRMITPHGVHMLYRLLNWHARASGLWSVHARSMFYCQRLSHHCQWTLQVTPPTHVVEEGAESETTQTVVKNVSRMFQTHSKKLHHKYALLKLCDGGAGTSLEYYELSPSLERALKSLIYVFGLTGIAEPFCNCDLSVNDTTSYRMLKIQKVTFPHITHMHFMGSQHPMHCWKRNTGFFVSLEELISRAHMPAVGHQKLESLLSTATYGSDYCQMLKPEKLFLKTLVASTGTVCRSNSAGVEPSVSVAKDRKYQCTTTIRGRKKRKAPRKTKKDVINASAVESGDSEQQRGSEGDRSSILLNLVYVRKMYRELAQTEAAFRAYPDAKFYIKHWPHQCPLESASFSPEESEEVLEEKDSDNESISELCLSTECREHAECDIADAGNCTDGKNDNGHIENSLDMQECPPKINFPKTGAFFALVNSKGRESLRKTLPSDEDTCVRQCHEQCSREEDTSGASPHTAGKNSHVAEDIECMEIIDVVSSSDESDCEEKGQEKDCLQSKVQSSELVDRVLSGNDSCKLSQERVEESEERQIGHCKPKLERPDFDLDVEEQGSSSHVRGNSLGYTVHLLRDGSVVDGCSQFQAYSSAHASKSPERMMEGNLTKQEVVDSEIQGQVRIKQETVHQVGDDSLNSSNIKKESFEAEDVAMNMMPAPQKTLTAHNTVIHHSSHIKTEVVERDEQLTESSCIPPPVCHTQQRDKSQAGDCGGTEICSPHLDQCSLEQTPAFCEEEKKQRGHDFEHQTCTEDTVQEKSSADEDSFLLKVSDFQRSCSCREEAKQSEVLVPSSVLQSYLHTRNFKVCMLRHIGQAFINNHLLYTFTFEDTLYFSLAQLQDVGIIFSMVLFEETICSSAGCKKWLRMVTEKESAFLLCKDIKITASYNILNPARLYLISAEWLIFLSHKNQGLMQNICKKDIVVHRVGHICPDGNSLARVYFSQDKDSSMIIRAWSLSFSVNEQLKALETRRMMGRQPEINSVCSTYHLSVKGTFCPDTKPIVLKPNGMTELKSSSFMRSKEMQFQLYLRKCESTDFQRSEKETPSATFFICSPSIAGGTHISRKITASELVPTDASELKCDNIYEGATLPASMNYKEKCLMKAVGVAELNTEGLTRCLGDHLSSHDLILTGTLCTNTSFENRMTFRCFQFKDKLYVNWGEVNAQVCGVATQYSLACRLQIFFYSIPESLSTHMARYSGCRKTPMSLDFSSKPWVCVNSLNAMAWLGSLDSSCNQLYPKTTAMLVEQFRNIGNWNLQLCNLILIPKPTSVSCSPLTRIMPLTLLVASR